MSEVYKYVKKVTQTFDDKTVSLNQVYLNVVTENEVTGSGYVTKIAPRPVKSGKKGAQEFIGIFFTLSDGMHTVECLLHDADFLENPWGDEDELMEKLGEIKESQNAGLKLVIQGKWGNYKQVRYFMVESLEADHTTKDSQLDAKEVKKFLSLVDKENKTVLELMNDVLWTRFHAPDYIKKAIALFMLNPHAKHEMIHIGLITQHGEGKDTLIEKVIQPVVECGVVEGGPHTSVPSLVGAMDKNDLTSVGIGVLPKMNNERIAVSEFQAFESDVWGHLLGAMANGQVVRAIGQAHVVRPSCLSMFLFGNPPSDYKVGASKKQMMSAFGEWTPQIVSRLTLIFTQLKLSGEESRDAIQDMILSGMDNKAESESEKEARHIWQIWFREYLRYVSQQHIPLVEAGGLIKSVYKSLTKRPEFQDIFHSRGQEDNRKWAEFVNLCRAFARLNGHTKIENKDLHDAHTLMLESLKTLTTEFDIGELQLDLTGLMRKVYLELKENGSGDVHQISSWVGAGRQTVRDILKELEAKGYVKNLDKIWLVSSDEAPNHQFSQLLDDSIEAKPPTKTAKKALDKIGDSISDELLDELEGLMEDD